MVEFFLLNFCLLQTIQMPNGTVSST